MTNANRIAAIREKAEGMGFGVEVTASTGQFDIVTGGQGIHSYSSGEGEYDAAEALLNALDPGAVRVTVKQIGPYGGNHIAEYVPLNPAPDGYEYVIVLRRKVEK